MIVSLPAVHRHRILQLNGFQFAGATLEITPHGKDASMSNLARRDDSLGGDKQKIIDALKGVIQSRYDATSKFLDLSRLGSDPGLVGMGMFESTTTGSKMFPALMKIIEEEIPDSTAREEAINSVSLADNSLSKTSSVVDLAQTLPTLRNLDLSNNQFPDISAIKSWRGKFPKLQHLIFSGNPMEIHAPTYKEDLLKWFPVLTNINNEQVRTIEDVQKAIRVKLPFPTLPASFRDEGSIGKNFLEAFFPMYDHDRNSLVNTYYDAHSTFSLSINTSAPRGPDVIGQQVPDWGSYIKKSRNLTKLTQLPAKMSRLHTGAEAIREVFATLPATRHPNLTEELHRWCLECHAIPGLPDLTGQSASGVGGLMVMVHGEFAEVNIATGESTATRSFDRTFILGAGSGSAGVRVSSDILVLRSYGGHEAWQPDGAEAGNGNNQVGKEEGLTMPGPEKSTEQMRKEIMILALKKETGLTLAYAEMCLEQSQWNLDNALMAFKQAMAAGVRDCSLIYKFCINLLIVFTGRTTIRVLWKRIGNRKYGLEAGETEREISS